MRWQRGHTGGIEDRRGESGGGGFGGLGGSLGGRGGGMAIPAGLGGGALVIVVIVYIVISVVGGGNIGSQLGGLGVQGQNEGPLPSVDLSNQGDLVEFMGYVLDDANSLWADTFQRSGKAYTPTKLVLFDGSYQSGCGPASSATGPFYCPADQKVYLDLGFFQELTKRFGAKGDFAQAYVLAHEVGHHVQQQSGIEAQVRQLQQQDPSRENELSVKMELQADCLAGVWAQTVYQQGDLQAGDIDEALSAASAVGDDRIQAGAGMTVNPETWTHGSAAQRSQWFNTGYKTGDPAACNTFQ
jgi:uncharacterized protein